MPTIYTPSSIPLRIPFAPNKGFNFTKPIHIRNRTTKLTNYPIEIELNTSNFAFEKAQSDGADIRFQDVNGKALSYWIESWTTTSAKIWVKLDELESYEDRIVWMIYGNSHSANASSGANTFDFFDDFEGDELHTDRWEIDSGAVSVANSKVTLDGTDIIRNPILRSNPYIIRTRIYITTSGYVLFGAGKSVGSVWNDDSCFFQPYTDGKTYPTTYNNISYSQNSTHTFTTGWHIFEIKWKTGEVKFTYDGITAFVPTTNIPDEALYLKFNNKTNSCEVDWVSIRKYISAEPLIEIL